MFVSERTPPQQVFNSFFIHIQTIENVQNYCFATVENRVSSVFKKIITLCDTCLSGFDRPISDEEFIFRPTKLI